jgi:hypothetical protein
MTPQERDLVTELFDRLAALENAPRDSEADRAIIEGLRRAPNATYALVQTALVQDEALKRADARIRALEANAGEPVSHPTGFLDGMRDALLGRRDAPRGGSVPSVRPGQAQPGAGLRDDAALAGGPAWRAGPAGAGGSFLGTAAAAAAGVIGGSLMLDGIRSMMGGGHGAFAAFDPAYGAPRDHGSPWDNSGGGDLARQAGIDDIGRDRPAEHGGFGLFGNADDDITNDQVAQDAGGYDDNNDFGSGDFGGDAGGGDFSGDV